MKLAKYFTASLMLTTVGTFPISVLSSCNHENVNTPKSIDGSDWQGIVQGKFQPEDYDIDPLNKYVTYTNARHILASDLVVPNYVSCNGDRYRVFLGESCFLHNDNILNSIEMNDFISSIPKDCFNGSTRLVSVIFHQYPKTFEPFAFFECKNLTNIYVKQKNTLFDDWTSHVSTFDDCCFKSTKIGGTIIGGQELQVLANGAFALCDGIENVNLSFSSQLLSIDDNAFFGCRNINYLFLPKNINRIGNFAFSGCEKLLKICLYDFECKLSLGESTFSKCYLLEGFDKDVNITTCGESCFSGDEKIKTEFWVPANDLSIISASAFFNTGYTSITVYPPELSGPEDIQSLAFSQCKNLHFIDVSYFISLPRWTGSLIFEHIPSNGTIFVSDVVWNGGDVSQEWYDFFDDQGLEMAKKDDPYSELWHFEC